MNTELKEVLEVLLRMVEQYCDHGGKTRDGRPFYNHDFMCAGEDACEVLNRYKLISHDQFN